MAQYTLENVQQNKDFLEFIKQDFGYNSFDEIPPFETEALLYRFRSLKNDLDDFKELDDYLITGTYEHEDELKEIYFGDKNTRLSPEDEVFFTALGKTMKEHPEFSLEEVRQKHGQIKHSPNNSIKVDENTLEDTQKNYQNDIEVVVEDEPQQETKQEPQQETKQEPQQDIQQSQYETIMARGRSDTSDENEFFLDMVKLEVLKSLGYISEDSYNQGVKSPENAIEELGNLRDLSQKEVIDFENGVADKMLQDQELFLQVPPKMLGQLYDKKQQEVAASLKKNPQADVAEEKANVNKLEERIDSLTAQAAHGEGLCFADVTNIADTYEGYNIMFDARSKYLGKDEKSTQVKQNISTVRSQILEPMMKAYDQDWSIENISEKDVPEMDERFDSLQKQVKKIYLDEETLALVSNFKFLDKDGKIEPQFVDENGYLYDSWQQGLKIIEGSKLETLVNLTKQHFVAQNLTSTQKFNEQQMQSEICEMLPGTLYAFHVADKTAQGAVENIDQFTNKKYLADFMVDLRNIEKPMQITHLGYEAALDKCVDDTAGLANRMAQKLGRNKAVVMKVMDGVKQYDKRAKDRTEKIDKHQLRKELKRRTIMGAVSAFLVSGAITTVGTIAASEASLTAATGGLNKVAGMALGTGLASVMLIRQYRHWRKDRKEKGQKANLWKFVKQPRQLATIATTAMGAAALGFAATGNPGVATALGYASLTIGAGTGIITNYQDTRKAGLSKKEALGWASLQTVATVASGFLGRAGANGLIDLYNHFHPDNNIFQHEEKTAATKDVVERETVSVYKEGVVENAQKILHSWYNENPDLLQQRVDAINAYNAEHGTDINPYRYLLAAHDAGALTADNNLLHVQGGADVHSMANHKVLGAEWSQMTGISQDSVNTLAGSVNGDGVNITPESIKAFQQIDNHISDINQVGHVASNPHQNDGVLGFNAEIDANGTAVHSHEGTQYTTYANHDGVWEQKVIESTSQQTVEVAKMVPNETNLGVGMVGIVTNQPKQTLKERIGSFLDKINVFKKKKEQTKQNLNSEEKTEKENTTEQTSTPKSPLALIPEKAQSLMTKTSSQTVAEPTDDIKKYLIDEYKIVHGIAPDDKETARYLGLVKKEQENDAKAPKDMLEYLTLRRKNFEKTVENVSFGHRKEYDKDLREIDERKSVNKNINAEEAKRKLFINKTRQTMWQSNLGAEGSFDVTLLDFEKIMTFEVSNSADRAIITQARDKRKAPQSKGKQAPENPINLKEEVRSRKMNRDL